MENEDKIVIELKATGAEANPDENDPRNADDEFNNYKKQATKTAVTQAVSWAAQEVTSAFMYNVSNYLSLSDDYKLSVSISNVSSTIGKVQRLASSAMAGAQLGTMLAPGVGTMVGTAIGIATDIMSEAFSVGRQWQSQSLGLMMNDRQTQMSQQRLGLVDNGRGTEN